MTDINHNSSSKKVDRDIVMIAIDIAKRSHDALIKWPSGKKKVVKVGNNLDGYQKLLGVADYTTDKIQIAFEPTADYHRNIAFWFHQRGADCYLASSLMCARAREMLFKTWDKNDRKDARVILHLYGAETCAAFP